MCVIRALGNIYKTCCSAGTEVDDESTEVRSCYVTSVGRNRVHVSKASRYIFVERWPAPALLILSLCSR